GPGAVEGADPRARVALRLRRRPQRGGVLRLLPPPQGRQGRAAPHPHAARRRLRAARPPRAVARAEPSRRAPPRPAWPGREPAGGEGRAARRAVRVPAPVRPAACRRPRETRTATRPAGGTPVTPRAWRGPCAVRRRRP